MTGVLGAICFTCDARNRTAFKLGGVGQAGKNPFNSFLKHCTTGAKHGKARDKVGRQIDALLADPMVNMTRSAVAHMPAPAYALTFLLRARVNSCRVSLVTTV